MSSITDLLMRRSCSDQVVLVEGATGRGMTWQEVSDQAARWEACRPPEPVGLAISDPVVMASNFVAALCAGVIVAPLDPTAPVPELMERARQMRLRSLVTGPERRAAGIGTEMWVAGRRELRRVGGAAPAPAPLPPLPHRPAVLMASSGTTGTPKIIPITQAQLLDTAGEVAGHLDLRPGDRGYSPLPLFHINGLVVGVLSALVAGNTIVLDRKFSRRDFWDTAIRCRATWLNLVPAILAVIGDTQPPIAHRVRLARSASAPLPEAVKKRFEGTTGVRVVETYGMTEAASQITANPIGAVRDGSVGRPAGIEMRVFDGRVQIRGARVSPIYWSMDDGGWSFRQAINHDGWLDTGDLGRVDNDGYLYLSGREGDVINRGGEKILPREVEEVLLSDPRVAAAVVVGRRHSMTGEEPVAYVLPAPGAVLSSQELSELCESSLSRFKRPAEITIADTLPSGPTGKVRRADVRALAAASNERN